ncbi:ribonuclease III [Pseudemcibacter aquimaris]|uniref:ribonuclease III n=1 Tax=Pseudemcibacter aquimaris TaxID=2857064 RepID=UPI00201116A3|nr:ribonuclease III [Pseudemcibacter aquimaris]MCC3860662.1 ribonuclease III [Pseudemcibacter aquimaris]WDU59482.1 ribonuclease III [Pseudemcibacter aquimaris]
MTVENGQYSELYEIIGYSFKNEELIREALTHPSLEGAKNYQRLEFVGDRVLGLAIAAWMFELYPDVDEGGLASRHTNLVRREACAKVGEEIGLGDFIHMAKSSEDTGGRKRETIIADVSESIIGAIYLDANYQEAEKFIRKFWKDQAYNVKVAKRDAKTRLQELVQSKGKPTPNYVTVDKEGPDHQPVFTIALRVKGEEEEQAKGKSKREAEQNAAEAMLERLEKAWNVK